MMTYEEAKAEAQRLANEYREDAVVLTDGEEMGGGQSYWAELNHVWLQPFYNPDAGRVTLVRPE